jgi:hypothetical protein
VRDNVGIPSVVLLLLYHIGIPGVAVLLLLSEAVRLRLSANHHDGIPGIVLLL